MRPFHATFAPLAYILSLLSLYMYILHIGVFLICEFIVYAMGLHSLITHGNNENDARASGIESVKESLAIRPSASKLLIRGASYIFHALPLVFSLYMSCIICFFFYFDQVSFFNTL